MKRPASRPDPDPRAGTTRARILSATFQVLAERGYGATHTREIAARAQVSKREIYSEFGSKAGILAALIAARGERMRKPLEHADVGDRASFAATLERVSVAFLEQLCEPAVVSMFRLAIASAEHTPALAAILDDQARQPNARALRALMASATKTGVLTGEPSRLASRFFALLAGDLHVWVLLGVSAPPKPRELERHARDVTDAFLQLHGRATKKGSARPRARAASPDGGH
jgi:AcrR family transcriptional regulator